MGSHAVLALRDAGYGVVVNDNLVTGFRWAVPDDVAFVQGDISDPPLEQRTLRDHGVTAVIHFAGSVEVPETVGNRLTCSARKRVVVGRRVCKHIDVDGLCI